MQLGEANDKQGRPGRPSGATHGLAWTLQVQMYILTEHRKQGPLGDHSLSAHTFPGGMRFADRLSKEV